MYSVMPASISLNNAEIDSVLATKSAKLALAQAEYQQRVSDQNAMTTSLERQQAALAVAQAERQVVEAQQNQAQAAAPRQRGPARPVACPGTAAPSRSFRRPCLPDRPRT
jgi:hypothetical protein